MKRPFWSTIRGKLVSRTLLVVMIPLVALGGVAVAAVTQLSRSADDSVGEARAELREDVVGGRAVRVAEQVATELAVYLDERLDDVVTLASSSLILDSARSGAAQAEQLGLDALAREEVEELFTEDRQLGSISAATELSIFLDNAPDFEDVFFTDRNGFNVTVSDQPSDMVQSDEIWWLQAWRWGVYVDQPEFDDSAGVYSADIAVRLDDGDTAVGVLRASLDIGVIQQIADSYSSGDDGFDVTIVAANGSLLAETASDHSTDRVFNEAVGVAATQNPRLSILTAPDQGVLDTFPEYSVDDDWIAGYSTVFTFLEEISQSNRFNLNNVELLDWIVLVEQPADSGFQSLIPLETLSEDIRSTSFLLSLVLVGVAALGLAIGLVSSLVFSRRITDPIEKLRNAAVEAADESLPAIVAQIDEMGPDEELPELEPVAIATGDEVEDLAHSFNSVQQTAAALAAEQARMRRQNVATTFVSLGRRNQNLLSKQLEHINAMEQTETDSETLRRLFQLDHLATRMRRNAESLLVLAGEDTPRRFRAPVSIRHLVQAAGGEIEEFGRIEMGSIEDGAIEGGAASDVAHLLAELLENASRFSPPTTQIQVHGRRRPDGGYTVSILDQGIGMKPADLETANSRLADPVEFDRAPSAYLGLFVVGHLARRHGVTVSLSDSPVGGMAATVQIPVVLLVSTPERSTPALAAAPADDEYQPEPVPPSAYENDLLTGFTESYDEIPPWFDEPAPAGSEGEAPTPEPAVGHEEHGLVPGMPTTTTMPITIPTADVEPFSAIDSAPDPTPSVWNPGPVDRLHGDPPMAAPTHGFMRPTSPPSWPAPTQPEDQGEATAERTRSGFRRRRKGKEGAPTPPAPTLPADAAEPEPPRRDAAAVQASLARFRAGVTQGRVQSGQAPAPHAAPRPPDGDEGS